jgi:hypothetical protein
VVEARLRHAAHGLLAAGRAGAAVPYAARVVARDPLEEAHLRCSRVSDRYQWVRAYVLDAMAATVLDQHDHAQAGRLADTLAALAARGGMRELVVRAHLHRGCATGWRHPACPPTGRGPWSTGRSGTPRCPPPPASCP